jgi:uncharacterized RDD family membrane protein YckC
MEEKTRKAGLLLRVLAKSIDLAIFIGLTKLIPQAGVLIGIAYILISDGLFDGRSIGKKMVQLSVLDVGGGACTIRQSVLRNSLIAGACVLFLMPLVGWLLACIVLAFEWLMALGNAEGKRLGDDFAGTQVVEDQTRAETLDKRDS